MYPMYPTHAEIRCGRFPLICLSLFPFLSKLKKPEEDVDIVLNYIMEYTLSSVV
jgi:hypothetical protein